MSSACHAQRFRRADRPAQPELGILEDGGSMASAASALPAAANLEHFKPGNDCFSARSLNCFCRECVSHEEHGIPVGLSGGSVAKRNAARGLNVDRVGL
jgi:hypothetical protein